MFCQLNATETDMIELLSLNSLKKFIHCERVARFNSSETDLNAFFLQTNHIKEPTLKCLGEIPQKSACM